MKNIIFVSGILRQSVTTVHKYLGFKKKVFVYTEGSRLSPIVSI